MLRTVVEGNSLVLSSIGALLRAVRTCKTELGAPAGAVGRFSQVIECSVG